MSDLRMVAMTAEQAAEIDLYVEQLMREKQEPRATLMMTLALAWRFAKPQEPDRTNVVDLHDFSRKVGA